MKITIKKKAWEKPNNFRRWCLDIMKHEMTDSGIPALKGWRLFVNRGGHDGLTIHNHKRIYCGENGYALFLHELAHAMLPPPDSKDKTGHGAIWADLFTILCKKYLVPATISYNVEKKRKK